MINRKYRILDLAGKGRSSVYLVEDLNGIKYALKVLPLKITEQEERLFEKEYYTLRQLSHPGIVKAFDKGIVFENNNKSYDIPIGCRYILLEYFPGHELNEYFDKLTEEELTKVLFEVSHVLYYLHQSRIVFYDLKPENILLKKEGTQLEVKLIDLGLAERRVENNKFTPKGTAEYIAPEILQKLKHDHRVDFYSLGIILYRFLYKKFPFVSKEPVEIYKEKVEFEIDLSLKPNVSNALFQTLKKLLHKNPDNRYDNALQLIYDLDKKPSKEKFKEFTPAKIFSGRKEALERLNTYLNDSDSHPTAVIKGFTGSGKTMLLENCNYEGVRCLRFEGKDGLTLHSILEIISTSEVFFNLPTEAITKITSFLTDAPELEKVKSIFHILSQYSNFILVLEDFNLNSEVVRDLFLRVLPLLQVNSIKTILTEESSKPYFSDVIYHNIQIELKPFNGNEVKTYLSSGFIESFPVEKLEELILKHSDLLPGNIHQFICDLVSNEIIFYELTGIKIDFSKDKSTKVLSAPDLLYKQRISSLNKNELLFLQIISGLGLNIQPKPIYDFTCKKGEPLELLIEKLQRLNLASFNPSTGTIQLYTNAVKEFIYSGIDNKKALHQQIIKYLFETGLIENKYEYANQCIKSGNIEKAFSLLKEEYREAERISGYLYKKQILEILISLPLKKKQLQEVEFEIADTLYKMGEFVLCLEKIKLIKEKESDYLIQAMMIEGLCLIKVGSIAEGRDVLSSIINRIEKTEIDNIYLEIASADIDLNNFGLAESVCNLYVTGDSGSEKAGKAFNLLGLIKIKKNNDFEGALKYFLLSEEKYIQLDNPLKIANIQSNIGNVYSIKGNISEAARYWNKSLKTNAKTGNLHHEANLLLNYGIMEKDLLNHEQSVKLYERAKTIFTSLGDLEGIGLSEINLGEMYYFTCEYGKAETLLNNALNIFRRINYPMEIFECLMLLGKIHYSSGDFKQLENILKEFSTTVNSETPFKYVTNYNYLRCLSGYDYFNPSRKSEELDSIGSNYIELDEKGSYIESLVANVKFKIEHDFITEAYDCIKEPEFQKMAKTNNYVKAVKEYLTGLLAEKNRYAELGFSINYFLNAYDLIKDLAVNELTKEITYKLATNYYERGNKLKAKEFALYTLKLIEFVSTGIYNDEIKELYINLKSQKQAIEICSKIIEQ